MQAGPGAPFEVIEAKLAFHLLLVALDAPPELGKPHEGAPRRRGGTVKVVPGGQTTKPPCTRR